MIETFIFTITLIVPTIFMLNYGLMKRYGWNMEKYAPYFGQYSNLGLMLVKLKQLTV